METTYQVYLISENENLKRQLQGVVYFDKVMMDRQFQQVQADITIIDDQICSINDLLKIRETIESSYIFYRVQKKNFKFSTKSVLDTNDIHMLQPYMTDENVVEYICSEVIERYKYTVSKNIMTFFGSDTKVGTTQIAQSVAEKIVSKSHAKVCLLYLDGEAGTDYIQVNCRHNIDTIKIKLVSGLATVEEIFDVSEKIKDNLYVIEGSTSILYRKEYQPEHIMHLLSVLSVACDLVIVDAGSYMDRAMPIAALTATHHRYLVTTQQAVSLRRYLSKKPILERLSLDDFQVIVNKHIADGSLMTTYDIAKTYGHPLLGKIEFSKYALQAENDKKALIHYKDRIFNKDMDTIVDTIMGQLNIKGNNTSKKRKWFGLQGVG
ncbi:hypothetical protein HZI73_02715 [Vallitalea pronyensis]|uniref:Uncharacterized protein n=1 Tax=Vallitalea pronyensis TaxID=1348613 RepID=A0A8J8MGN8_9FIRM|nr:hypothetical protein [Vallitalea pronyensis]QUI21259.1 hypothetical protein HZI73_02715 [Vallitalea pronyensis]